MRPLAECRAVDRGSDPQRWAHLPYEFRYGDYFLSKVSKVFPDLATEALNSTTDGSSNSEGAAAAERPNRTIASKL